MTSRERGEIAQALAELYRIRRELRPSTVSYCKERLEEALARLEALLPGGGED